MADTVVDAPDYARERRLIEQLDFKIAGANTSEKLQAIIQKFLAPLLLKLASDDVQSRNSTIKICHYINQRLKIDSSIQLPVQALSKTFRESSSPLIKQISLQFVQQGVIRLSPQDGITTLPVILRSSIQAAQHDQNERKMFAISIDLLLGVLADWQPPEHGSIEDQALGDMYQLSREQTKIISQQLSYFILYDPKASDQDFIQEELTPIFHKHFSSRGKIVPSIANFVFTSIFSDVERFVPAMILSVDVNAAASSRANLMFKQCDFDLETDPSVDAAFDLYSIARTKLRTRILVLLSRSRASTRRTEKMLSIIESQLSEPVSNLEASKLRAAMFSYLIWAIRVSPDIIRIAEKLRGSLKDYIQMQGWPVSTNLSPSDVDLRSKAYESIGLLAGLQVEQEVNESAQVNIDSDASSSSAQSAVADNTSRSPSTTFELASWLLTSLRCDTTRDVRHSIEDSLSRLMSSTAVKTEDLPKFRDLLVWNVMAGDGDEDPVYHLPTRTSVQYPAVRFANKVLPLSDVIGRVINLVALTSDRKEVIEEGQRGLDPSWHAANTRLGDSRAASAPVLPSFAEFMRALTLDAGVQFMNRNGLLYQSPALAGAALFSRNLIAAQAWRDSPFAVEFDSEWQSKIDATLDNEREARILAKRLIQTFPEEIVKLLQLCFKGMAQKSTECGRVGFQLCSLATDSILQKLDQSALLDLEVASRTSEGRYFACRCIGIVGSMSSLWMSTIDTALGACEQWETASGQELAGVEVLLLKSACVLSRVGLRNPQDFQAGNERAQRMWILCRAILTGRADKALRDTACIAIGQLSLCLPATSVDGAEVLVESMLTLAKKENEVAVAALGRFLSMIWRSLAAEKLASILVNIYDLHEIRKAEFHFALGEAMAAASLRFKSSSTLTEFDIDVEPADNDNDHLFNAFLQATLDKSKTTKPALKMATGIWLLSLVQFCAVPELVKPYMREIQAAFSGLLGDRDEIVQETGSRGLGIVYEKGDNNLRNELVRDLVQSFTVNTAKTSGTVSEDTQLFEPGALPTENGQSITTYKDIVSLAQEMGDPSLVYRFMNLASNNAIWTSRAAFGRFGLSGVLSDSTYLKENKKFYPKLFRYRFDPNPNVQRSMNDIWKALVKDSSSVIDENFDLIMDDLLQSVVYGREWRAREASCAAISDLVQGTEIEKFEKYLDDIWKVAFKVLDDVKETVRVAAMKLCRTLTNMLLRNLDVGEGTSKRATSMLTHALPFLLQQMDAGAGKEVQQYAVVTLLDIVKKAPPRSLRNYSPTILETLVNSLSSFEHESINYLHLNAEKYGLTTGKLDSMRVSSIGTSPVTEAIEKCLDSLTTSPTMSGGIDPMSGVDGNNDAFEIAMKKLEASFKVTIGLPSKVGLSRVVITLVVRHHVAFRPHADRFARLCRKSILDRNATISQSFSTALAYVLRLSSEKEIRQTVTYAQKLYFDSQEVAHRAIAGEIVQAIGKASNDLFMNFASLLLPFAFIGRNDLDEDARERFDNAWKDNVGGSRALHLYLKEIADLTSVHIKSSLWPIRHACCFAVANLISTMESGHVYSREDAILLWPLVEEALSGKTWDGKEKVVLSFPKFVKRAEALWPDWSTHMRKIAIREAKRSNTSYRPYALEALGEFARIRLDLDMSSELVPFIVEIVEDLLSKDSDVMDIDNDMTKSKHSSESLIDESLCSAITCLFASLRSGSTRQILDQSVLTVERLLAHNSTIVIKSLYEGMSQFIDDIIDAKGDENNASEKDAGSTLVPKSIGADPTGWSRFLHSVVLALFQADLSDHTSYAEPSETLRLERTSLALQLASQPMISLATREALDKILRGWLERERSRPLRFKIEQAFQVNQAAMPR